MQVSKWKTALVPASRCVSHACTLGNSVHVWFEVLEAPFVLSYKAIIEKEI